MNAIWVEISQVKGSTPRDAGTAMKVTEHSVLGTIGGGALEFQAIAIARDMLVSSAIECRRTVPLGPSLGQCCGGAVTLRFTRNERVIDGGPALPTLPQARPATKRPLWIWGAGHVGRAVVQTAAPTGAFDITWIDDAAGRFPPDAPDRTIATDMPLLAAHAPRNAAHLILTYSHEIDLALCAALLIRGFDFCGLIGSDTKWARFQNRLRTMGLDPAGITCPIGDKRLGKHPRAIAHGTLDALLAMAPRKERV